MESTRHQNKGTRVQSASILSDLILEQEEEEDGFIEEPFKDFDILEDDEEVHSSAIQETAKNTVDRANSADLLQEEWQEYDALGAIDIADTMASHYFDDTAIIEQSGISIPLDATIFTEESKTKEAMVSTENILSVDSPAPHNELQDAVVSQPLENHAGTILKELFPDANDQALQQKKQLPDALHENTVSEYFANMIQQRHPIVEKIVAFNVYGAKEIHPSHYEGSGAVLFKKGCLEHFFASHRASHQLAMHENLLTGQSRRMVWYTDFEHYTHRFALLPGELLATLSVYLGMTMFHEDVRVIIHNIGVQELRSIFGKKIADFGIRRVPLFVQDIASMYNIFSLPKHWSLEDKIRDSGRYALGVCVSVLPQFLQTSVLLRLPQCFLSPNMDDPREMGPSSISEIQRNTLASRLYPLLRKILILEVAPQWSPYFF